MLQTNNSIKRISGIEIFLLLSLLIFGSLIVFLTPLGGGYDEDQHLVRAWQLAKFVFIPREMKPREANYPEIFFELSYRKQPLVEPISSDFWEKNKNRKLYDVGYRYRDISTRSVYSPPLLLPQAFALRYLGLKYDLSVLIVYYGSRFAGLLSYLVLVWAALRIIPFYKWGFLVLAISPMAIYQASTISADSISNGIGLLFIAGSLAIYEKKEVGWRESSALIFLSSLLFLAKVNLVPLALLPFIIISQDRYKSKKQFFFLIAVVIVLFSVEVVGWNLLASSNLHLIDQDGISLSGQLKNVLSHPFFFFQALINDLNVHGPTYFQQWVGVYGYEYGSVPFLTYILFLIALVLALLVKEEKQSDKKNRIVLIAFFFLLYMATMTLFYFTLTAVGEKFVYGMQGRYFIPIVPLLLLPLTSLIKINFIKSSPFLIAVFSAGATIFYLIGLYLSFHVICGTAYYNKGLCYHPFYKNYAPLLRSSPPIVFGTTLTQEFVPVCDGLTEVRVRVNSKGNNGNGAVEFTIQDVEESYTIAQSSTQNDKIPNDDWYSINFPPEWESADKMYTITINGTSRTNDGPFLAYSVRPEYPLGILFENGNPLEDDIIFQYGCIAGMKKVLNVPKP